MFRWTQKNFSLKLNSNSTLQARNAFQMTASRLNRLYNRSKVINALNYKGEDFEISIPLIAICPVSFDTQCLTYFVSCRCKFI